MSPELFLIVVLLMGIAAVGIYAGEVERFSARTAATTGLLVIGATLAGSFALLSTPLSVAIPFAVMATLAAMIMAAPLLDRARMLTLAITVPALSIGLFYYALTYAVVHWQLLHLNLLALVAAAIIGLWGSALLAPRRSREHSPLLAFLGRSAFALVLCILLSGSLALPMLERIPTLVTGIVLSAVLCGAIAHQQRRAHPLRYIGMGLVAAAILMDGSINSLWQIAALAAAGSYCVFAGERVATALMVDDAHNITGTVLMPALAYVLLSAFLHGTISQTLLSLMITIAIALAISIVGWSAIRFFFGLSASPRLLREGMDAPLGQTGR